MERLPGEVNLTRNTVYLRQTEDILVLDYLNYDERSKSICLRFLNFDLQSHLFNFQDLWQPRAGRPFYSKRSIVQGEIGVHAGFIARVVELPSKGFGILVESTRKYVSSRPLPIHMTRDSFGRYKGKHLVYRFGHQWYEIKSEELSDLNVSEYRYPRGPAVVSLIDDLRSRTRKPHPQELADLPNDSSVLFYRDNSSNLKGVPSGLCYLIIDPEDPLTNKLHRQSILKPSQRRSELFQIRGRYLDRVIFGNTVLLTMEEPLTITRRVFQVPDFEFGNNQLLTVRGTQGARQTTVANLGKARKGLLLNSAAGFYSTGPFDRQYFILPKSIEDSMGKAFLRELKAAMDRMYPTGGGYNPTIISFDDRARSNYIEIGWEIINTVKASAQGPGYGVVMIPSYEKRNRGKHDELAALVIQQLQDKDIFVSIMHTETVKTSFYLTGGKEEPQYKIKDSCTNKFRGYITNVAINKVLLTNNKWPYVLNSKLFADLTIGIDVKNHTAGVTSINNSGKQIRTEWISTKQREKLPSDLIYAILKPIITKEARASSLQISKIVIHRDGKVFDTERKGILRVIEDLKREQLIQPDAQVAILEIAKHTSMTLRLFDVKKQTGAADVVENPMIGSYALMNSREAYLCSTGKEFPHDGTSNPILVRYDYGDLSFERVLEDLYYLTTLAFTRPEDCSRYPLTIKITDRRLSEVASEYDIDAFSLVEQLRVEDNE